MISKYSHKELTWIDLEFPTEDEILYAIEQYSIPGFIKEEILSALKEDKIQLEHGYIFASFEIPHAIQVENIDNRIIFVVNDNLVLTIHHDKIKGLTKFSEEMELDIITIGKINNNKLLFAYLLKNLYVSSQQQLVDSTIKIKDFKRQINQDHRKFKKIIAIVILLIVLLIVSICLL